MMRLYIPGFIGVLAYDNGSESGPESALTDRGQRPLPTKDK